MIDRRRSDAMLAEARRYAKRSMWWNLVGLVVAAFAFALALASIAHADPKDGNPSVTINGCDVTIRAENRNAQTLGYLIRIGAFKGDGRIVEEGTLRPGESITRHYHGAGFYRVRLGLNSDHYYSSDIGSTTCPSPTPSPSPPPSPSPSPSESPTPSPSPSPSTSPSPSPSESPSPPPSPSPSIPPPLPTQTTTPTPSSVPSGPGPTNGTPSTGNEFTAWFIAIAGLTAIGYALWRGSKEPHV